MGFPDCQCTPGIQGCSRGSPGVQFDQRMNWRRPKPSHPATDTDQADMPRPTKAFRQKRLSAAAAWKRGDKKEAYTLWEVAAAASKEHLAKKRNKKKPAQAAEGTDAAAPSDTSEKPAGES